MFCLDFSHIRQRLAKRMYSSLSDFKDDIMQVFITARSRNMAISNVKLLEQWFLGQMNHVELLQQQ